MFALPAASFFISAQAAFGRQVLCLNYPFNWDNRYLRKAGKEGRKGEKKELSPEQQKKISSNVFIKPWAEPVGLEGAFQWGVLPTSLSLTACQAQQPAHLAILSHVDRFTQIEWHAPTRLLSIMRNEPRKYFGKQAGSIELSNYPLLWGSRRRLASVVICFSLLC